MPPSALGVMDKEGQSVVHAMLKQMCTCAGLLVWASHEEKTSRFLVVHIWLLMPDAQSQKQILKNTCRRNIDIYKCILIQNHKYVCLYKLKIGNIYT